MRHAYRSEPKEPIGSVSVSKIHFLLLMASVSKYLKDTEDTPCMYLYLVLRYKIFVSVETLFVSFLYSVVFNRSPRETQIQTSLRLRL